MRWLMRFLRRPRPTVEVDDALPPLFVPPQSDPKYERARRELDEVIARGRRMGYELDGVTRRIHADDHATYSHD